MESELKFFLLSKATNTCYYTNDFVNLEQSSVPNFLKYPPIGWKDINILNVRNRKYFGLDRSLSVSLSFVEDGAFILKKLFYEYGIEADCVLVIMKKELYFDPANYGFYYSKLAEWDVDFSTFSHESHIVQVNVVEGGFVADIKAKEANVYEFDIDQLDPIKVRLDPVKLFSNSTYKISRSFPAQSIPQKQIIPFDQIGSEGFLNNIVIKPTIGDLVDYAQNTITTENLNTSEKYLFTAAADSEVTIEIKGSISGTTGRAGNQWFISTGSSDSLPVVTESIGIIEMETLPLISYPFSIKKTFNVLRGHRVFLYRMSTTFNNNGFWNYNDDTTMRLTVAEMYDTTFCNCVYASTLFSKIIEKITDKANVAKSDLLDSYKDIVITSGDSIRRVQGAKIKTSLSQFFDWANSTFGVGLGIKEGKVRLESKSFFIDNTSIVDLGEISDLKVKVDTTSIFNNLKIGYPEVTYDEVNGKNEFNIKQEYSNPIKKVVSSLSLLSPYRADCYGIEFLRIEGLYKESSDTSSDNDVFVIKKERDPYLDSVQGESFKIDRSLNSYASGILDTQTVYNLFLTPKRNLLRNASYLASCFYRMEQRKLTFLTANKQNPLVVNPPFEKAVFEREDVLIGDLDGRIFHPILFEMKAVVPFNLTQLLIGNSGIVFTFTTKGIQYKGISMKVSQESIMNNAQNIQLLSHPDNDLTQLIEFYE
ncbi:MULTISPECIES: hypothetical protein [unclassified Paraflavitalea]|uniref:hypothetical protein n=1 Tax=unclassified Paraflavitalea TaxID=2798305 RepID=UPI003D33A594